MQGVGRKFKSIFTRTPTRRRSPPGRGAEDAAETDVDIALEHPQQGMNARDSQLARPSAPSTERHLHAHPQHEDSRIPRPATQAPGQARESRGKRGCEEIAVLEASSQAWGTPYPYPLHNPSPIYRLSADEPPQPFISASTPSTSTPGPPPWQGNNRPSACAASVVATDPSYFAGAHDINIHSQYINHTNLAPSKTLFEHLDPHIAHGAAHDSSERCNAPACHEETRVAIRQNIMSWINHGDDEDQPERMMWLSGPAGGGKTAIAGSVAQQCKVEGSLAATFMFSSFSGSADRMSKRCFIATLAYHISQHDALRSFETHLLAALERRRDIFHKSLKDQTEHLILAPLQRLRPQGWAGWPKALIIDGLDEVVASQSHDPTGRQPTRTSEEDQVEILEALLTLSQSPYFPFRILVSSRPESHITEFFVPQTATVKLFLDWAYDPDADIRLFLQSKFAEIRRRRGIADAWPGEDTIDRLVDMSSGQFIVPTTAIRWVETGVPQARLDEVLRLQQELSGSRNPFASLDVLYRHILRRAGNPDDDPRLIVKWILLMHSGGKYSDVNVYSAVVWRHFLEDWEGEFGYRTERIASLMLIPPLNDPDSPVTFYHKSFSDFLSTKVRCGDELYVDDMNMFPFIARRLLHTFKKKRVDVPAPLPDSCLKDLALLFVNSNIRLSQYETREGRMKGFLLYDTLTADYESALSACDVVWSIDLILDNFPSEKGMVGVVYCTIHKAMGCNSNRNTLPSPERDATNQRGDSQCHPTCERWRTYILTKAKEIGLCVHRLAEVKLDALENMRRDQIDGMFKNVRETWLGGCSRGGCEVCLIPAVGEASYSTSTVSLCSM